MGSSRISLSTKSLVLCQPELANVFDRKVLVVVRKGVVIRIFDGVLKGALERTAVCGIGIDRIIVEVICCERESP
jgi:hypothetical protein